MLILIGTARCILACPGTGSSGAAPGPAAGSYGLLLESGSGYLLLESGDFLLLE